MKHFIAALLLGILFGLGLATGGMTNPQKVLAFLDISGDWDPSLLLLMATAIVVTFILYRIACRIKAPVLSAQFHWPTATRIDMPVLVGPAIFGVGWGIGGVCPGPALELSVTNPAAALWFIPTMLIGLWIGRPRHRPAHGNALAETIRSNG